MTTKIEYDVPILTISALPTVESHSNIYNLIRLEEIMKSHPPNLSSLDGQEFLWNQKSMYSQNPVHS